MNELLRNDKGFIEGLKKLPKDKLKKIHRMAEIACFEINDINCMLHDTPLEHHALTQNKGSLWGLVYDLKMAIKESLKEEEPKTSEMEISGQAGLE